MLVIFILGNLISGAISIQQATKNVESSIKERLGTAAVIEPDYTELDKIPYEEWEQIEMETVSFDLLKQVGELNYVKYYDYTITSHLNSDKMKRYEGDLGSDYEMHGPAYFEMKGINYAPVLDFEEKRGQLVDGRVFTPEEIESGALVTIISKKLAELNGISVGDQFILQNNVYDYSDWENGDKLVASRDVVMEVIGLFEPLSVKENDDKQNDGWFDYMDIEYQNTVYVSNELVITEMKYQHEEYAKIDEYFAEMMAEGEMDYTSWFRPVFVLKSPDVSDAFKEEVLTMLPNFYTVRLSSDQYDSISGPVNSMAKLSNYVLNVSVIATVLIIGLVVLLFLRDRKRELGIFLSLGERRGRVIGQIMIEVMVIALVAISLSLFTGNLLAQGVSHTMMENDSNEQFIDHWYHDPLLNSNLTTDDVVDSFQVALDGQFILMFYIVGLLTILVSTLIPLTYIVRLNPKKIMM
ncbi:MAG: FtsX-like permease family protein [Bacillaceae bacterium]|nr:FtsX-like permease family protein [Bacillaceae bacterium]